MITQRRKGAKNGEKNNMAKRKSASRVSDIRVVLVTAPPAEAEKLARKLLDARLIACANLIPGVKSLYWWDGKINRDAETIIMMKTSKKNVTKLLARVKQLHSYSVPEFLTLKPMEGNPDYLAWVEKECSAR